MFVVKSRTFRDKIADKLSSEVTSSQLKSMISCSQVESTLIFQVNVTSTSPQLASDVANTIESLRLTKL
jgi:capsular polysaccharide biosynthesis protein